MGTITLSDKQQRRAAILGKVLTDEIDHCQAADILGLSERQVRRLLERWKTAEGGGSRVHGTSRSFSPTKKTSESDAPPSTGC